MVQVDEVLQTNLCLHHEMRSQWPPQTTCDLLLMQMAQRCDMLLSRSSLEDSLSLVRFTHLKVKQNLKYMCLLISLKMVRLASPTPLLFLVFVVALTWSGSCHQTCGSLNGHIIFLPFMPGTTKILTSLSTCSGQQRTTTDQWLGVAFGTTNLEHMHVFLPSTFMTQTLLALEPMTKFLFGFLTIGNQ